MGANATNAVFFLVTTLFDLALWIWMLRLFLQWVRADFYNPLSQLIWKVTRFPADTVRPFLKPVRNFDIATALALLVMAFLYIQTVSALLSLGASTGASLLYALLKLAVLVVNLFTFTLFVQAIMSWLGPGVNNPASNILWSLNEPLLRPVRRFIPVMSGLDLSPLAVILALQVVNRLIPLPAIFR